MRHSKKQRWGARASLLLVSIAWLLCFRRANAFQAPATACTSSLFSSPCARLHASSVQGVEQVTISKQVVPIAYTRYSASDWWHNIQSLPRSTILREIKNPVLTIVVWSAFVSLLHTLLAKSGRANMLCLSSKPHSLLVSSLGLLLVFRTNSAYQRFAVSPRFIV